MRRNLDLTLLRTFVTIAETGAFTRAGDRLAITQPTVSLQIKRLEEVLDKRLFERSGRQVHLTESGRQLLAYARRMVEINDDAVAHLLAPDVSGIARLGVVEEFACGALPDVLAQFNRAHSGIHLELKVGLTRDLLADLDSGDLHLVIGKTAGENGPGRLPLMHEPLAWVTREDLALDPARPVPLIVSPAPCIHRQAMLDVLEQQGRSWEIVCHAPTLAGVRAVVLAGLAVSALDLSSVLPGMRILRETDGFLPLPDSHIVMFQGDDELPPAAARLAEFVAEAVGGAKVRSAPRAARS